MIVGAAFCPHPPVLVPEVAQGAAAELDELRAACRTAIRRIARPAARLVVLGAGDTWARHEPTARGSFAGYGVDLEVPLGSDEAGPVELPLSLTVGAWLLRDALGPDCGAVGWSIGPEDGDAAIATEPDIALLVMGDGSARRSLAAPGYFDERAPAFDQQVVDALRRGRAPLLHTALLHEGESLLAAGLPAWDEAAWLLEPFEWDTDVLYNDAPYGVGYLVAAWTARG